MKRLLKSLKRQDGFTLVELMVVVAIIGLLSAVAIPNFKKYQAKAKVSEAKLQLSGLYMAMTSFFSDFNTYAGCLSYMGYNPAGEKFSRYYGVGFNTVTTVPGNAYSAASNSGLNTTACASTYAAGVDSSNYFLPGKGAGAVVATAADLSGTGFDTTAGLLFTAGAAGVIDGGQTATTTSSALTVNEAKRLIVVGGREGY
jgi:type IV pilus assembly protein PilA